MSRQIIFDTETTGISPDMGDRIVEIGCIELIDRAQTGNNFHVYLNPERDMPDGAFKVHGLSADFLSDKPLFKDIAESFLEYIQDAELIAHNSKFDMGFLDAEYLRIGMDIITPKFRVIDTLAIAKELRPGQRNSLDALCRAYSIDNTKRTLHGALLDAQLLTEVYLTMTGGQYSLMLDDAKPQSMDNLNVGMVCLQDLNIHIIHASADELEAHQEFSRTHL